MVVRMSPDAHAAASESWVTAGATLIGGCCDTNPGYIAALARRWRGVTTRSASRAPGRGFRQPGRRGSRPHRQFE
jgi:hypothetical protein